MAFLLDLFDLIWSQTIVAYFQNWPSYGGGWGPNWLLFFCVIPFFCTMISGVFFTAWYDNHSKKYPVDKDSEPEKELPKVPEGLFAFSIKEDSWFVKKYLKAFKRYPRSTCDYAPYCAGLSAMFGFGGWFVFGLLVFMSNALFYWLWVGLWKGLLAIPQVAVVFFTEFVPWLATSLFAGATGAVNYIANSSISWLVAVFVVVFVLATIFLRSQTYRATKLWAYSTAKRMCIPIRIVPVKK